MIGQAATKKEETLKVLDEFKTSPHRPLLIISYEQFRIHATFLQGVVGIDLVICDEVCVILSGADGIPKGLAVSDSRTTWLRAGSSPEER